MSDQNQGLQFPNTSPLGPVGPSLEDEEKAMRKGKGRMIAGMVIAVLAIVGLGAVFLLNSGEDQTYANLGRKVNGLDQQGFDQFWSCSLRGASLSQLRSDQDLRDQINRRALAGGRYSQHVRDECMGKLDAMQPELDALLPPADMQTHVQAIKDAVAALRSAWTAFTADLATAEGPYDAAAAEPKVTAIARAWYDYRTALSAFNSAMREKLGR